MRFLRDFASLEPGDHACLLYDDRDVRDSLLTGFLDAGIRRGERTVLIREEPVESGEAARATQGEFDYLSSVETYMPEGRFDPDTVLKMLATERDRAIAAGFTSLRTAGEPPLALRRNGSSQHLVSYERDAQELFAGNQVVAVCAYHIPTTSPHAIIGLIQAHPVVFFAQRPTYRLRVERRAEDRVALSGWLDITTIGSLVGTMKAAADDGHDMDLDLAELDFIDLAGIRLFAETGDRLHSQGAQLRMQSAPRWMPEILELLGYSGKGLAVQ